MAIANSDGSVILGVEVNTSQVEKGISNIKSKFASLKDQRATLQTLTQGIKDQQATLNDLNAEYAQYVAKGKQSSIEAQELRGRINDLTAEMKEMQGAAISLGAKTQDSFAKMKSSVKTFVSYFIGIQSVFAIFNFSKEASDFATKSEAAINRINDIYGESSVIINGFIDSNSRALGLSEASAKSYASIYGNLFSVWADQKTNAELTNKYLSMTAVVASKTGRTVEDVQERIRSGLLGNTEAIEDLGIFVNVKTIQMTDAFKRMARGRSWEKLDANTQQQIRSMAILEQATAKYGNSVAKTTALSKAKFNASYEDFKASWGQVVNELLPSILDKLVVLFDWLSKNTDLIVALLEGIFIYLSVKNIGKLMKAFVSIFTSPKTISQIQLWAIAIGTIVGSFQYLANNWNKLSAMEKLATVLFGLATAFTTAAIAVALFHTAWSVGVAAAAIAGGIAVLAGTYLFTKNGEDGSAITNARGTPPNGISQYAGMAKGGTYK
jgi:hypothetical protein